MLACGSGVTPGICYAIDNGTPTPLSNTIFWQPAGGGSFMPQTSAGVAITHLEFQFNKGTTSGTPTGSINGNTYNASFGGSSNAQTFVLDGKGHGIQMGNDGKGKMTIDFDTDLGGADNQRTFYLNLEKVSGDFAFKGASFNIYASMGDPNGNETKNGKFIATFGKNVIGNINTFANDSATNDKTPNTAGFSSEILFKSGANLIGNFRADAGKHKVTFENGGIKGSLIARTDKKSLTNPVNTIIFASNGSIEGEEILALMGSNNVTAKNLTIKTKTITANGTSKKLDSTNNYITATGKASVTTGHISTTASTTNIALNGTHSSLTAETIQANGNGTNIILIGAQGSIFVTGDIISKNTTGSAKAGSNNIILSTGARFLLGGKKSQVSTLALKQANFDANQTSKNTLEQHNTTIDLATSGNMLAFIPSRKDFRLLTIGENADDKGLIGNNGFFRVYANLNNPTGNKLGGVSASNGTNDTYGYAYSDRVVVHKLSDSEGNASEASVTQYIQVLFDKDTDLSKITYKEKTGTGEAGNIAIFTTKNNSQGEALVDLKAVDSVLGFEQVQTDITSETTDANGKVSSNGSPYNSANSTTDTYTTYFLTSAKNQGVSLANQKTSASALGNNYLLYLANLNSLNKRMGELRENTHTRGTWARVFNGMQSTNFSNALDTRSIYTTLQGGYDYSFGFKGASNILGFALSYANSISKSGVTKELDGSEKGIKHALSNAFELAIYNAYVQDGASRATGWKNGLYTDSIVKFSYISSDLNLFGEGSNKTTNLAFTLSQEIGYRFLLGNDREFYIDPQGEITLGYLNQSNLKQTLAGHNLTGVQDAIFTFRSRIGSSYGYKFDKFTQNKGFNSSLYLGTYFVSDFIVGGDVHLVSTSNQALSLSPLASTARFVLNLGTNFKIKDNTRIYFDFERSFGGKITTDYQLNLGVRYSFGTSAYTPYTEANTQEIKDSNTLKEVEPTKGYYIEVLEKEANKLSSKEKKVLEKLKDNLKVQSKTQGNKTMKVYLVGAFKDEAKAKEAKSKLEGVIKELKGKGSILEVE